MRHHERHLWLIAALMAVALMLAAGCGGSHKAAATHPKPKAANRTSDVAQIWAIIDAAHPAAACGHMTARYLNEEALGNLAALDAQVCKRQIVRALRPSGGHPVRIQHIRSLKVSGLTAVVVADNQDGAGNDVIRRRFHFLKQDGV